MQQILKIFLVFCITFIIKICYDIGYLGPENSISKIKCSPLKNLIAYNSIIDYYIINETNFLFLYK